MTTIKYLVIAILSLTLLALSSCSEESIDPKEKALNDQLNLLMNKGSAWVLGSTGSVDKDGYDVTSQFAGFKLTIGNKTYSTQNSLNSVWKTNGTWDFQNENPEEIVREDDVVITISQSNNNLILTFRGAGNTSGGRINSISGDYRFELVSE